MNKKVIIVLVIIAFVLIIPFVLVSAGNKNRHGEYISVSVPDVKMEQIAEEKELTIDIPKKEEHIAVENAGKSPLATEETENEEDSEPEDKGDKIELIDGIRPEFKESMDSYEEFFAEYADFMKKYTKDPANAISMLGEYTEMMVKYTDAMGKMDKLGDSDLNDAELKYYIEVTGRINQNLLSVSLEQ